MAGHDVLTIHLPVPHMDKLAAKLMQLTKAIHKLDPERISHGFFGGEYGYGGDWDSPTFFMKPYCWCMRSDCPWCEGEQAVNHAPTVLDRFKPLQDWTEDCPYHDPPNFWHKPSNLRVIWYKYIGRDMETNGVKVNLKKVFDECLADVRTHGQKHN